MPILIPKHILLRPHGNTILTPMEGGMVEGDTIQCVHCGSHGIFRPGAPGATKLGWCEKCAGKTCGRPQCEPCLHKEKRLDLFEKGLISFEELAGS